MEIFLGILAGVFALAFGILLIVYLVKTHMDKNTIAMYSCKLTAREIDLKNLKMDQASANSEVFAMQSIVEKLRTESSEKTLKLQIFNI